MDFVIRLENEARLHIEQGWTLLPRASFNMGAIATPLPEWSLEQQLSVLGRLRGLPITDVELREPWHDLALTFGSEWVMFINGQHDMYETWQLELDDALLVSIPNGSTVFPPRERSLVASTRRLFSSVSCRVNI